MVDVVIACRLPRRHKRTNEPPCSTISTFTCTDNQLHYCYITRVIVVEATDKRSGYYKYGEEHCCCF